MSESFDEKSQDMSDNVFYLVVIVIIVSLVVDSRMLNDGNFRQTQNTKLKMMEKNIEIACEKASTE